MPERRGLPKQPPRADCGNAILKQSEADVIFASFYLAFNIVRPYNRVVCLMSADSDWMVWERRVSGASPWEAR